MKDKEIDKIVPVMFQKLNTYESEDTRFIKVKIWLMHTGENLNGSSFDKSVVEEAIPTLANTPILAYIEDNSEGEKDFSDHRMVLVKEEGKTKIKYIGQAIGLIPETNNAQFEMRLCDDGVEREYLTVDGVIWTKWDDPVDIFDRDIIHWQSMELHDDYEGEWKDDGLFHFTKFSFFGACALGKEVLPAMKNSTIEAQFSQNNVFEEIQEKMNQFKHIKKDIEGGNEKVDKKLELLKKYSMTEESLKEKNINIGEYSVEDLEVKLKELESTTEFSLTASQMKSEIRTELYKEFTEDDWGYKYRKYWYVDHTDGMVIAEDSEDGDRLVGIPFTINNDTVSIDFEGKKRVKIVYETIESDVEMDFDLTSKDKTEYELNVKEKQLEKSFSEQKDQEINIIKSEYADMEKELNDLKQFKSTKLEEERSNQETELYSRFSSELTEEEIEQVKETSSDFTLEQLEEKLFVMVGKKKATFSAQPKKEKQTTVKVEFENKTEETYNPYSILEKYQK